MEASPPPVRSGLRDPKPSHSITMPEAVVVSALILALTVFILSAWVLTALPEVC